MLKYLIAAGALVLAGVPAAVGLAGNDSFRRDVPVRVPEQAQTAPASPVADDDATTDHGPGEAEPGDDNGGTVPRDDRTEVGDDHGDEGGDNADDPAGHDAGDDHGDDVATHDAGDDHGGASSTTGTSGSTSTSGGSGSDDGGGSGSDDSGSGGSGDSGGSGSGSSGGGSDDGSGHN